MGRVSDEEAARVMASLVMTGHSCGTCKHNEITYGDCPWEPDARYEKPVVNGTKICHRHSAGPLTKS